MLPDYAELHAELLRIAHRELSKHRSGTLETRALVNEAWLNNTWSEVLALGAYALLILYFIKASMKVK